MLPDNTQQEINSSSARVNKDDKMLRQCTGTELNSCFYIEEECLSDIRRTCYFKVEEKGENRL